MTKRPDLGLDAGSVVSRVALARPGHDPLITSYGSGPGGRKATAALALRDAVKDAGSEPGRICIAVPDAWLDGDVHGAQEHEAMRAAVESDQLTALSDPGRVSWVGQLSAAAAIAATRNGASPKEPYLVCDAGGTGIRAGLFTCADRTVRLVRAAAIDGGGCADFDAGIRTSLASEPLPAPAKWFTAAATQHSRAEVLLRRAATDDNFRAAPVYERAGLPAQLTAGLLLDSFEPTAERLRSAVTTALAGATPSATLLVGGLTWFPLVADVVSELVPTPPENLGAEAAVKGALTFASGQAELAPVSYPDVGLPAHEIRAGLLTQTRLPLPWLPASGDSAVRLTLDSDDLVVDIAGTTRTVHVPGLVPGPYRISIRPGGTGRALLVLRPDYGPSQNVLISPLDLE